MRNRSRAVIFDLGGVLVSDVWEPFLLGPDGIAATYNLPIDAVEAMGKELWQQFAHRSAASSHHCDSLEAEYWHAFIAQFDRYFQESGRTPTAWEFIERTDQYIEVTDGMPEILGRLRDAGVIIAVCSNNNPFWLRRQTEKLRLSEFVSAEHIFTSCRLGLSKPNRRIFAYCSEALGVIRERCAFVDDRLDNVKAADILADHAIHFPSEQVLSPADLDALLRYKGF